MAAPFQSGRRAGEGHPLPRPARADQNFVRTVTP
ncbi:hypothetical protein BHE75_00417 [Sphingomonas haloaromaticamans]|uniref:Uncharacterized protein n=1 Tax=Edaphosphingomonas haloaromaticamans TaxID=653954 RepID=A0A1S1H9X0_9SPHN|nr:hypothetical protein BHE75_00417 [Sphingomonas haloaromaticamans]